MDDAFRQTFQKQVTINVPDRSFGGNAALPVPSGKRAVIEHVSASGIDQGGHFLRYAVLTVKVENNVWNQVQHFLVSQRQEDTLGFFNASQPLRAYSDPGTTIVVEVQRAQNTGTASVGFTVSGYYVAPQ